MKYITIEIERKKKKSKVRVGYLCAEGVEDAYEQMGTTVPSEEDEVLVLNPSDINQLIIDLNKTVRKL